MRGALNVRLVCEATALRLGGGSSHVKKSGAFLGRVLSLCRRSTTLRVLTVPSHGRCSHLCAAWEGTRL